MKTSQNEEKLIVSSLVFWGLVQVVSGLSILATVLGFWGQILFPLNKPLFVFAAGPVFINAGTCIIAFAFAPGKFLRVAVFATAVMSMIFGGGLSVFLIVSRHENTRGNDGDSTDDTAFLLQLTFGIVIAFGNSFTSVFFSLFLPRCCASTPGLVHLEEQMDNPQPPPYFNQSLETKNFVSIFIWQPSNPT